MRKLFLIILLLIPINVLAVNDFVVDTEKVDIKVGEKKTINITAKNSAGKLDISSDNSKVASLNQKSIFLDNNTEKIIITGNSVGKTNINIVATKNYATYDEEILEGEKVNLLVNVQSSGNDEDSNPGTINNSILIITFVLIIIISSLGITKTLAKKENI